MNDSDEYKPMIPDKTIDQLRGQTRYSEAQLNLVFRCLIAQRNSPTGTANMIADISRDESREDHAVAKSIIDYWDTCRQTHNRLIHDIRRQHYTKYLETILDEKGYDRLIQILEEGDPQNALKTIEFLTNNIYGKPTQKVELETTFITNAEVNRHVKKIKAGDGEWVNPEDEIE